MDLFESMVPGAELQNELLSDVPVPSRIPEPKWKDILQEEHDDRTIAFIREEIVRKAINSIYSRLLERASYSFTVDCARTAILQAFDCTWPKYHILRKDQWTTDAAPEPSPQDTLTKRPEIQVETCSASCSHLPDKSQAETQKAKAVPRARARDASKPRKPGRSH